MYSPTRYNVPGDLDRRNEGQTRENYEKVQQRRQLKRNARERTRTGIVEKQIWDEILSRLKDEE